MIPYSQLIDLVRSLRETRVLSVYRAGAVARERAATGRAFDDALTALREAHRDDSPSDREALERAIGHVGRAMAASGQHPGWVAFATPEGVRLAEALPVPTPLVVLWGSGPRLAPLLEALKEHRPAIIALAESRMARIYRYAEGTATYLETIRAQAHVEPPAHMGGAPRSHFHTGTRGRTGTDQIQRERLAGRERLMRELASRMADLAGADGWLLFGGAPIAAKTAYAAVDERLTPRSRLARDLHLRATPQEIAYAAAKGASLLRRDEDLASVRRLVEELNAAGHGVIGHAGTSAALAEQRLHQLFVSRAFIDTQNAVAERLIRLAIEQGILVEAVAGVAADLLDRVALGVAGRTRYTAR